MSAVKDIKKFADEIIEVIDGDFDKRILKVIGDELLDIIKDRTRSGKGVSEDFGATENLAALSPNYIKQRERMRLSRFTRPEKSNLTRTGRMLGGLKVKRKGKHNYKIEPTGRSKEGISNKQIAEWVQERRPFLFVSAKEADEIIDLLDKLLTKGLKNI